METLFWTCLLLGLYPYVGYPALAWLFARLINRGVAADAGYTPAVTVVISAYNEDRHIRATVLNKLEQDYPSHLLDVIVMSDGSEDGTDDILREICTTHPRVRFFRQEPRAGKTSALNAALGHVQSEVVVFSDANSIYRPDTIRRLVANFADSSVGYVTGSMRYVNPDGSLVGDGCSAFMRYENWLREVETRIGAVVGVDGGVDAVRRALYRPMRADQLPDFVLPLTVVEQGARVVYEPEAILNEDTLTTQSSEYRMRVRVALRAFWALWDKRGLLNPLRTGVFALQLWSHKALRYLSFLPLALTIVLNWVLVSHGFIYILGIAGQVMFALMLLLAHRGRREVGGLALPAYCDYFALVNWASAVAFLQFLRGEKKVIWQPRQG